MRIARPALVLIALFLGAAPASGRDADAYPTPSDEHAFDISCYVLERGAPYGRLSLSARPEMVDGVPHWRVRDAIRPLDPAGDRVEMDALLDRRLGCVSGNYHRRNAQGFLKASWKREGERYTFEYETQEYENRLHVESKPALTSLAGLLLFLRFAPAGVGVHEMPELDPNPTGGDPLVMPARVEVHRKAPWRVKGESRDAWILSFTRGKQAGRLALDPKDGAFLGMTFLGLPFMFVPEGSGPVGLVDPAQPGVAGPIERAVERTRRVRAAMPLPTSPLTFRGQVRFEDIRVGSVLLQARPSSFEGEPAWETTEARVRRSGEAEVRHETTGFAARNLKTLRGERLIVQPTGKSVSSWVRRQGGIEVVHRFGGRARDPLLSGASADAMTGLVPVVLFLREVPVDPALYVLSGWDPRWARTPKAGSGSFATSLADVHVDVAGVVNGALVARCSARTGGRYDVHLDPSTRKLLRVVGHMPRLTLVEGDAPGKTMDWYDAIESAPKTARQVFIKFGRGYHRPREDLLADAFHWPSMAEDSIARGSYPQGTPEDFIKREWINVFVKMSKHRTKADCDDLLFQIFMTSRETKNPDGTITLATIPAYGGHTYRMKQIDDRWYIVKID